MSKPLLITDLNILIADVKDKKKLLFAELVRLAKEYQETLLSATPPASSTTYMGIAIFNLSLLYKITSDRIYLEEAKRWINTVISYDVWGYSFLVNVDLSASWILFGLSLGYQYLYDGLAKAEQDAIRAKLIKQATIMFEYRKDTYGKGWSTHYFQNHNWINMTGLATIGYVLRPEYEKAQEWIDVCRENFTHVYPNLADDGSDYEGVPYWHYGVLWLLVYADLLKKEEGIDYFQTSKFLQNTFDYKMSQTLPDLRQNINFGDSHDYRSGHSIAIYYKLASEYRNGYAQYVGNYVLTNCYDEEQKLSHIKPGIRPEIGLALVWYDESLPEKPLNDYPLFQFFPDLGLMTIKKETLDASMMLSVKCSKPGGNKQFSLEKEYYKQEVDLLGLSHQHPDNAHYLLVKDNEFYVIDDGYNRIVRMEHHNVITPGDLGCDVEDVSDVYLASMRKRIEAGSFSESRYGGKVLLAKTLDKNVFYLCENSGIYHRDALIDSFERTIITPDLDYVLIFDKIASQIPHEYKWHLHTDVAPLFTKQGFDIKKNSVLHLHHILPKTRTYLNKIQPIKALYTPQEPNDFHQIDMIDTIICSEKKPQATFLNVLSFADIECIDHQGYCEIVCQGRKDMLIYEDNKNFHTDAKFVYIKDYHGEAEKRYRYQGTYLFEKKMTEVSTHDEIL